MGTPVPIVQLICDGKYQLNEEELTSVVSAADGCQRVAVISIIGSEGPEKRFVLNCLADYLNSENKDEWPDITQTVNNFGSVEDTQNQPLVWLWSKPFILNTNYQNTAVFLMDSNHVFSAQNENSNTSLTDDIIGLFCGTSSTLIYLNRGEFNEYELTAFKDSIEKTFNRSLNTHSFEELIYLIIDWNTKDDNYLFGSKGVQQYLKEFMVNLDHFFNQTKCYLLPPIGEDFNVKTFIKELLKFIENKLLNIDEMNVKKGADFQCIEPIGLVSLFEQSVQQMNESFERRQSLSNTSSQSIEFIDKEEQNLFSNNDQETGQSSNVANELMENTEKEEQLLREWISGDKQNTSPELTHNSVNDFKTDWSRHLMSTQELNNTNVKSKECNELADNRVYNFCREFESSFVESVEEYDKRMQSLIESAINNQMTNIFEFKVKESELTQFHIRSKDNIFKVMDNTHGLDEDKALKLIKNIETKFEDHLFEIMNNYRKAVKVFEQYLEDWNNALNEGIVNDVSEENRRIIKRSDQILNDCNPFVKSFSLKLFEQIFPAIETRVENRMCEIRQNYETIFTESVKHYEKGMSKSIKIILDCNAQDIELFVINDRCLKKTYSYFRDEVNRIDKSNHFTEEFVFNLSKQLNSKKSKFDTALGQINQNRVNWMYLTKQFDSFRYLSEQEVIKLNKQSMDKFIRSGDEELDSIVKKQFDRHFEVFIEKVKQLNERENSITEKAIERVIQLFEMRFNNKLISGFFTKIEVNAMFDKLLDYTLKSVLKRCEFNEYQNHLIEVCYKDLDIKLRNYLTKAFAKHSQNSVNAKEIMKQTVDSSVELYANQMKTISSGIQIEIYHKINQEIRRKSLHYATEQMEQILDYFNDTFYHFLLIECQKQITERIALKSKELFEFFEKNTPKETSIAIYFGRFDFHTNIYEEGVPNTSTNIDVTPNCIAFDNKIIVGKEALKYLEKLKYDITTLSSPTSHLFKSRSSQTSKENKFRVRIDSQIQELSVESLIALQILDIKTNAEKQTNTTVKSAVFTVPTHSNIKQRNAMKDVANIAGIESVDILTQITAAAIAYASDIYRPNRESEAYVLFVAINDNKCDASICKISQKQIAYKYHFQYELSDSEMSVIQNLRTEKSPKDRYKKVKNVFKVLTEDVSKTNALMYLKNVVIIGSSDVIPEFKFYIENSTHYTKKEIYECDPINIIVKGSAIYGNPFYKNHFDITEATLYPIGYMIRTKFSSIEKFLTNQNTSIPTKTSYTIHGPNQISFYPILIEIYQQIDEYPQRVEAYRLDAQVRHSHPMFNQNLAVVPNYSHNIIIGVKDTGLPFVESVILPNDGYCLVSVNITPLRIGLSLGDIMKEKEFIQTYWFGSTIKEQLSISSAEPLVDEKAVNPQLERSKQELESLYSRAKERIEKCDKLSPHLRESYEQRLSETLAVIQSEDSNIQKIDENKQIMEKIMQKTERFIK